MLGLIEVRKTNSKAKGESSISVGDIVVMKDDSKRVFWNLAIVEDLLTGSDGQDATVKVGGLEGVDSCFDEVLNICIP